MLTTIAYIFGAILLYIAIWLLYVPLKMMFKLLCNSLLGCMGLIVSNFAFGWLGLNIGVNIATMLVAGVLGVPGIALLIIAQNMFR